MICGNMNKRISEVRVYYFETSNFTIFQISPIQRCSIFWVGMCIEVMAGLGLFIWRHWACQTGPQPDNRREQWGEREVWTGFFTKKERDLAFFNAACWQVMGPGGRGTSSLTHREAHCLQICEHTSLGHCTRVAEKTSRIHLPKIRKVN